MSWGKGAENNSIGWGQGDNNSIGWGLRHLDSWSGDTALYGVYTDPDAQAFITAAGITDPTQQSAVNKLVVDLKAASLWTKMKAVYPFVGGSSSSHKWNLKDPRDLDAAFRLVFNGGWTHNTHGITGNGINTSADTKLNCLSILSQNDSHLSYYSRTNNSSAGVDMGTFNYTVQNYTGTAYYRINTPSYTDLGVLNSSGLYLGTRRASNDQEFYRNGTSLNQNSLTSQAHDNSNIFIGNRNNIEALFTDRNYAFASIGDGLSDTDVSNLYTAVQAFQTTLGRNV